MSVVTKYDIMINISTVFHVPDNNGLQSLTFFLVNLSLVFLHDITF